MSPLLYLRNALADAAADCAAEIEVQGKPCAEVEMWAGVTYNIALRLAHIEAEVWEKTPKLEWVKTQVYHQGKLDQQETLEEHLKEGIRARGHELRWENAYIHCTRCRLRKKRERIGDWMKTESKGTNLANHVIASAVQDLSRGQSLLHVEEKRQLAVAE